MQLIHKILFSFHINRNWNFRASWERIKEVNVMHMFELHPNSMQLNFLICPISSKNFSNFISNQSIKVCIPRNCSHHQFCWIVSQKSFFRFWIWLNDICLDKPANRKKNVQNNQALNISSLQNSFSNSFNSSSGKSLWVIIYESY